MVSNFFGVLSFNADDGRLQNTETGAGVTLRPQAARLLATLLAKQGEVIPKDDLFCEIWGEGTVVDFEAGLAALLRELRKALTEVGAEPELVETVRRRGVRFRAPSASRPRAGHLSFGLIALLVIVVLSLWWRTAAEPEPSPPAEVMTLAVLPFERLGDPERSPAQASLLVPDALLARLWTHEFEGLVLIGRASLRPYEGEQDIARLVAADLGVNLLIEGSIVADEGGWTVSARLLRMPQGRVLWSQTEAWPEAENLPVSEAADRLIRGFQDNFRGISEDFHGLAETGGAR